MTRHADTISRSRRLNPVRDARRQAQLTRMLQRPRDYIPTYRDTINGRGEVVASTYTGHIAVYTR